MPKERKKSKAVKLPIVPNRFIDDAALDRIISLLKKQITLPKDFDREALKQDINTCGGTFLTFAMLSSNKLWRNRNRKLKAIQRASTQLANLLDLEAGGTWLPYMLEPFFDPDAKPCAIVELDNLGGGKIIGYQEPFSGPRLTLVQLVAVIQRLKLASASGAEGTQDHAYLRNQDQSPFEWFAGNHLADMFHTHFKTKPTVIREKGSPARGAFVEFAAAVLGELSITQANGIPYSIESIATAKTKAWKPDD